MKNIQINREPFQVKPDEFNQIVIEKYESLNILSKLGIYERIVSLIRELSTSFEFKKGLFINFSHGGYIPIKCSRYFQKIILKNDNSIDKLNVTNNISTQQIDKYEFISGLDESVFNIREFDFIYCDDDDFDYKQITHFIHKPVILAKFDFKNLVSQYKNRYRVKDLDLWVYIPTHLNTRFQELFKYWINDDSELDYDNLINLCIMVKNGGELFKELLLQTRNIIDKWTILDTGSTDGTIANIKDILKDKKGDLYQEPFINFRESRNRCLELAGTDCKYNLMLDDTYIIDNKIRGFLSNIRGDQFADSFSIFVKSHDIEYLSNRITISDRKLRYIYTVHEIIQTKNNINVKIPVEECYITDKTNDFMENRSKLRVQCDLNCLLKMIEDDPNEPRQYYYTANAYKTMGDYTKAAEYYYKRAFHPNNGFDQEKMDALYEYTRISQYQLNPPLSWIECEKYYNICHLWQPTRPESSFMIAVYYYNNNAHPAAFEYFKKTFQTGFPYNQQYSLKPTLSFIFTPYYLAELCFEFKDYKLGMEVLTYFFNNNRNTINYPIVNCVKMMTDWYKIFALLNQMVVIPLYEPIDYSIKPVFCIIADGGFSKWTGKSILNEGVGGSETWVIETARNIAKLADYNMVVFCNCNTDEESHWFENVEYLPLTQFIPFISKYKTAHCMISRFSEYIPVTIESYIENIHIILHDIQLSGNIIPIHPKIKNVFCLSKWHSAIFLESFPQFKNITSVLHYGIDLKTLTDIIPNYIKNKENNTIITINKTINHVKIPFSFIYSSFPNRGLLTLLKLWPKIQLRYKNATLNIFVDLNNKWVNQHYPNEIIEIKRLLKSYEILYPTIINHGWVKKHTLASYWKQSQVWLYPCKFAETFCLTALEAAITKTMVFTNDLAGLQDTVGNRGFIIKGDSTTNEWTIHLLKQLFEYLDNPIIGENLINANYEWALTHSWIDRTQYLLNNFIKNNDKTIESIINETNNLTKQTNKNTHIVFVQNDEIKSNTESLTKPITDIEMANQILKDNILVFNKSFDTSMTINVNDTLISVNGLKHNYNVSLSNLPENISVIAQTQTTLLDRIYYINLNRKTNRNSHFLQQCITHEIPLDKISRFSAIDGLNYVFSNDEQYLFRNVDYKNMRTRLQIMGNQLSHYNIFKEMVLQNYKYIIICQDDIVFKTGFYESINNVLENLSSIPDTEIIHFAFHKYGIRDIFLPFDLTQTNNITIDQHNDNNMIGKLHPYAKSPYDSNNSLGYILTLKGAVNFIKYTDKYGFSCAADHNMNSYMIERNIYYGTTDVLATTNITLGSDIFTNFYNENKNPHKLTENNNFLNYLNRYNWTNDLPLNTNAKLEFVQIIYPLIRLNSCSVLEIGAFCGTSIIGILQYLPNAKAVVIENWTSRSEDDYKCEQIFKTNIKLSGMEDRIVALNGKPHLQLLYLIEQKRLFDFIYIDCFHKGLDYYMECLLSWQILKVGGIMGINDYMYVISQYNILDNCFDCVNYFLEKIKGEYTIILQHCTLKPTTKLTELSDNDNSYHALEKCEGVKGYRLFISKN